VEYRKYNGTMARRPLGRPSAESGGAELKNELGGWGIGIEENAR
jgi:hypothetical protein